MIGSNSRHWSGRDIARAFILLLALAMIAAYFLRRDPELVSGPARPIDGDSLIVEGLEIRLLGIDAPELSQTCEAGGRPYRCGEEAKRALAEATASWDVTCDLAGRDRYGRHLARCSVAGEDLGARLVARGRAIAADGAYETEQSAARQARLGLWAGTFEPPAAWRKTHGRDR